MLTGLISLVASAGGGGSSSGGGGGGGGSSSSGGSSAGGSGDNMPSFMAIVFFAVLPAAVVSAFVNFIYSKKAYDRCDKSLVKRGKKIACAIGVIVALFTSIFWTNIYVEMRVEERREYNQSLDLANALRIIRSEEPEELLDVGPHSYDYIVGAAMSMIGNALGVMLGMLLGGSVYSDKLTERIRQRQLLGRLSKSADSDPVWDIDYLQNGAQSVFLAYQRDWSNLNIAGTRAYLTDRYYNHVDLMLTAFRESGRLNNTVVHRISSIEITDFTDADDDTKDRFTAHIKAYITDQLVQTSDNNRMMSSSDFELSENWVFNRDGDSWRLDGINPSTAAENTRAGSIQHFAETNGAYYSLDWGRMLLPERGQIFDDGVYKIADVNNHVIGRMQSTGRIYSDDVVYQIYTYSATPYDTSRIVYLVGQLFVPKNYGNILLLSTDEKRRQGKVHGLRQIEMEWGEFNDKFQVFATSPDQVAAFELLNPTMMQALVDAPFSINIEVIDNAIYFYAPLSETSAKDYQAMLSTLQTAYRELQM